MTLETVKAFALRQPVLVRVPLALLLAAGMWLTVAVIIVVTLRAIGVLPS